MMFIIYIAKVRLLSDIYKHIMLNNVNMINLFSLVIIQAIISMKLFFADGSVWLLATVIIDQKIRLIHFTEPI